MLTGEESDDGWAQIGYLHKNQGVAYRFFLQWTEAVDPNTGLALGLVERIWGDPLEPSVHNFKVSRYDSDQHIHLLLDDAPPTCPGCAGDSVTDFDPFDVWFFVQGQWFGETKHSGSDVPGTSTLPADFTTVEHVNVGGSWTGQDFNLTDTDNPCWFHNARNASDPNRRFKIWNDPYNHVC